MLTIYVIHAQAKERVGGDVEGITTLKLRNYLWAEHAN
jgi:hypothetical protein